MIAAPSGASIFNGIFISMRFYVWGDSPHWYSIGGCLLFFYSSCSLKSHPGGDTAPNYSVNFDYFYGSGLEFYLLGEVIEIISSNPSSVVVIITLTFSGRALSLLRIIFRSCLFLRCPLTLSFSCSQFFRVLSLCLRAWPTFAYFYLLSMGIL